MKTLAASILLAALQFAPAEVATREGGRDIVPRVFHGTWASTLAECRGSDWVDIDAMGYRAPDNFAAIASIVRTQHHRSPSGEPAFTVLARVRSVSEGQQLDGRIRLSRAGPQLYMSNPEVVDERGHWQMRNLRCPNDLPGSTPDILAGSGD